MTRLDEIKKKMLELEEETPNWKDTTVYVAGFMDGAMWADQHPHWLSVEDELPKDGQYVATINTVGVKDVRHYSHGKWYSNFGNEYDDITHWMHLPQPPKEGGAL